MRISKFSEAVVFSRIVGAALLVCGWLVAGLFFSRWLTVNGYPAWTVPLSLLGGTACALLAGWREVKGILETIRKNEAKKDG